MKPAELDAYKKQLEPLDPILAVGKLGPAAVFYQFATKDKYVPAPTPRPPASSWPPTKPTMTSLRPKSPPTASRGSRKN